MFSTLGAGTLIAAAVTVLAVAGLAVFAVVRFVARSR